MIGEANDLIGYKALRDFKSEDGSMVLDRGDKISVGEYDSLSFDEQEAFTPEYKTK